MGPQDFDHASEPPGVPRPGEVLGEPHAPPGEPPPRKTRREQLVELHGRGLRAHAARGSMINAGFMVGLSTIGFLRGFALAIFLTAEDYGVWGILVVSLGTILWLKQVGIGDKYIQQDEEDQELAFQKAFTLEAIFTGAFMLLLALLLPLIVVVYDQPKLLLPGLVIVAILPAGALSAPTWVYYRNMQFVRQRLLQSIDPIVGTAVSLAMAIAGAGYWALAAGVFVGAWCSAIAAVSLSPYKLRWRYDKGTAQSYLTFSWPLFVSNGSSMVIAQSAVIASNAKLGLAGTGAITLASNITAFTERIAGLATGSLYPAIAAVRDRMDLLYESFVKSNRLALMWAIPFGVALSLFCADLVHFVLGDKWEDAIPVLQIYGLVAAAGQIAFNWDAYMRATARTKPIAIASVVAMVTFLAVGLPLLSAYGLKGLAWGVAAQGAAHFVCRAYFLRQLFHGFSYLRHAMRSLLPTLPAVGVVLLARWLESGERELGLALAELAAYLVVTLAATLYFEGRLLREAVGYLVNRGGGTAAG